MHDLLFIVCSQPVSGKLLQSDFVLHCRALVLSLPLLVNIHSFGIQAFGLLLDSWIRIPT